MQDTPPTAAERRLDVRFVGSGSEYFRIWIVNLLLTLVTIGLYYPFAKVRKLRYFHGATEVGGHPLSFHADPWKMLRGYLLVGALFAVYTAATHFSEVGGVLALLIVAAIWPALWHSSLRFRLANTGWRGLRFRFTGSRATAYKVLLPWAGIAIAFVLIGVFVAPDPVPPATPVQPGARQGTGEAVALALLPLLLMLLFPALLWLLRRYQHEHFALGAERSRFSVGAGSFYAVFGLALLMLVGILLIVGVLMAILLPALFAGGGPGRATPGAGSIIGAAVLSLLAYVALLSLVGAYVGARLQNRIWDGTRSQHVGFESRLRVGPLARLTIKNWLLIVLTIGLYFPFAAVATAKLKLEAVDVLFATDPDVLVSVASHIDESAAGDAAGDLFGFDIGL